MTQDETLPLAREFDLIAQHFRPLAGPGARDLRDDVAVFAPPPGRELVITVDAMVAGVHFLPDDPPETVGRKLLRVNLSDIAAKGAVPLGYLMTVSAPRSTPDAWFAGFAAGLALDQHAFGVTLLGGDTTSTPGPISLSLTLLGHVAPGQAPSRGGARAGDGIWVTGTIGDGALGLAVAEGRLDDPSGFLLGRYRLPQPRLGLAVGDYASAAMDVSDGLMQDLGHICRASGLAAQIDARLLPLSGPARTFLESGSPDDALVTCLTGGDDYELLLAVPPEREAALLADAARVGISVTRIGHFQAGHSQTGQAGIRALGRDGRPIAIGRAGWSHF